MMRPSPLYAILLTAPPRSLRNPAERSPEAALIMAHTIGAEVPARPPADCL